jgi:hypothetical protein
VVGHEIGSLEVDRSSNRCGSSDLVDGSFCISQAFYVSRDGEAALASKTPFTVELTLTLTADQSLLDECTRELKRFAS